MMIGQFDHYWHIFPWTGSDVTRHKISVESPRRFNPQRRRIFFLVFYKMGLTGLSLIYFCLFKQTLLFKSTKIDKRGPGLPLDKKKSFLFQLEYKRFTAPSCHCFFHRHFEFNQRPLYTQKDLRYIIPPFMMCWSALSHFYAFLSYWFIFDVYGWTASYI